MRERVESVVFVVSFLFVLLLAGVLAVGLNGG